MDATTAEPAPLSGPSQAFSLLSLLHSAHPCSILPASLSGLVGLSFASILVLCSFTCSRRGLCSFHKALAEQTLPLADEPDRIETPQIFVDSYVTASLSLLKTKNIQFLSPFAIEYDLHPLLLP